MFRHLSCICIDYEQSLFSLGPSSKMPETRSQARALPLEIWRKRETAHSLAFARDLIYSLNKYNINVVTYYSIQYSQYVE